MKDVNILMVGVGGQGVISASDAVSEAGMNCGYDVKKTDSLGMAQRGGSVVSHVRWGKHVFSPMSKKGTVDFLLGFEEIEAARWASYLTPQGIAIVADVVLVPTSVYSTGIPYPGWLEIEKTIACNAAAIYLLPATRIGQEVGNPRALNTVMLGALSVFLELAPEVWQENVRRSVPPKFIESSLEAFSRGAAEVRTQMSTRAGK